MYEQPSRIKHSLTGCFPEKLRRYLVEQVCQGVKCKGLSRPEDRTLRYIRTCVLYYNYRQV